MTKKSQPDSEFSLSRLLKLSLAGAKANLWPGVAIWIVATTIVLGYYLSTDFNVALNKLGAFRQQQGLLFSIPSLAVCAGLIPFLLQLLQRDNKANLSWQYGLFMVLFWGYKGAEVDFFYKGQTWLFGDNSKPATLIYKVLVDQMVYVPIWAVPTLSIGFLWANKRFSFAKTKEALRGNWYQRIVLPIMIPNWMIWIPAVTLIYMLPEALQLPFQNLVACLFSCLVMFLSRHETGTETQSNNSIDNA